MFTAGQAPVTFGAVLVGGQYFRFPRLRRGYGPLFSRPSLPFRGSAGWGGAFLRSRPLPLFVAFSAARSLRFCSCCPRAAVGVAFWLFLFFCSSLCCPPAARTFLSPSSFLRRMAVLPVLPLFSFFCPTLRSLYWARPILMYVFDFLFLFIVLGASIGRYRRREGYRLRRNSAQLVGMGDAGGAVNIILERGWVKKERVGKRTDLAEGVREKRGTRGEGGSREGCGKHYFNWLPWCVGCRGGLWWKSGVP